MGRKTIINSITSPELLEKINPKNIRLKNDYITYLKTIGRAEKTVCSYVNDLDIFFTWNLQNNDNKFFVDLTKRDIISFQDWLINVNLNSPARVRRLKSTLSSLSNYIEAILDDDFPDFKSIIRKIESPVSQPVREKTVLSEEQLEYLLSTLIEKKKYQQACAVALAAYSGARKSELIRFKVDYFKEENIICGSLYKTPEKIKTKGRGNGKYIFKYVIVDKFKSYLDLWLEQREKLGISSDWLFVTNYGVESWDCAKPETLNSWALTNTEILGVPFYFHSLRHFYTTILSQKHGIPDNVIKDLVGWENVAMIDIYRDVEPDDEFAKYFDENGIKTVEQKGLNDLK